MNKSKVEYLTTRILHMNHKIDPKMLELLVCPLTKGALHYDAETQELLSHKAKLVYPIRQGVAILVASEARNLEA